MKFRTREEQKILEIFKKAIDSLTIKDSFNRSDYRLYFSRNGRTYIIIRSVGLFHYYHQIIIEGDAKLSCFKLNITESLYNQIDEYLREKLLSFEYRNPNILFCVLADTNGAHEAECIYSIWDNRPEAEAETDRLKKNNVKGGVYDGEFSVKEIELNKSSDKWIGC